MNGVIRFQGVPESGPPGLQFAKDRVDLPPEEIHAVLRFNSSPSCPDSSIVP